MNFQIIASILAGASDPWYVKLAGFAGGIVATFVGFFLNQRYQTYKDRIKEFKEYIVSLQSAENELDFYRRKLIQLSGELDNLAKTLDQRNSFWIVPTYSIYPDFLEKCKITINGFFKNPNLVKELGHCHFELCHILARLDLLKKQLYEPLPNNLAASQQMAIHAGNVKGFKGLVDSNIPVFKAASEAILEEKTKMEEKLRLQKERSLIGRLAE